MDNPLKLTRLGTQDRGRRQTKQKKSRETGNMGYTRRRQTKQKQFRETGCQFLWIVFALFVFVLCTLSYQFLWIVFGFVSSSCVPDVASFSGWGTQDEDKQNKNNSEKLATWGTQDKDKQNKNQSRETGNIGYTRQSKQCKNNPEKLAT
jgi:hypothetical protein